MNQSLEFRVQQRRLTERKHNAPQKTVLTANILAKGERVSTCVMEHLYCVRACYRLMCQRVISAFSMSHSLTQTQHIRGRKLSLRGLVLIAE